MPRDRGFIRNIANAIIDDDRVSTISDELFHLLDELGDYICRCEHCDSYVSPDDTHCVDDNESWCESCCNSDAHYWESDCSYHSEPEPDEDDCDIPGYHDTDIEIPDDVLERSDVLGVELETYQGCIEDVASKFGKLRSQWNDGFKFERDGSLDDRYGVEFAARPFTLGEIRGEATSPWFEALKWSRDNSGKAWDAGKGYGMHISLNGAALTGCHRARIVRFINDNKELGEYLAGRSESNWARFVKRDKLSAESRGTDKYQAASNRGDRIEVRIFRASLNWERFVRNCEYVDAVRVYTEFSGFSGRALSEDSFRQWLNKPENRKSYPLLAKKLAERVESCVE